jgi:hypothetical protein
MAMIDFEVPADLAALRDEIRALGVEQVVPLSLSAGCAVAHSRPHTEHEHAPAHDGSEHTHRHTHQSDLLEDHTHSED